MKVVFPRPDSPATCKTLVYSSHSLETRGDTMMVNAAPRLATILCLEESQSRLDCAFRASRSMDLWLGSYTQRQMLANSSETHENKLTLAMPIGEAASDIAGAMLKINLQGAAVVGIQELVWLQDQEFRVCCN